MAVLPTPPSVVPNFATDDQVSPVSGQNNVETPPADMQQFGWTLFQKPPRQWFNWLHRYTAEWINYFKTVFEFWLGEASLPIIHYYDANDTWTKPDNLKYIRVICQAAGGGGGGCDSDSSESCAGSGGGGGGCVIKIIKSSDLSSTEAIVIGSGGSGGIGAATPASAGGASSFGGTKVRASGGSAGSSMASGTALSHVLGTAGGTTPDATTDIMLIKGGVGGTSMRLSASEAFSGIGGSSYMSGGVRNVSASNSAGQPGVFGGGGSGSSSINGPATNGGDGGDGRIIVEEYFI